MKARNLDKNWVELYHSTRTNPVTVFSYGILWSSRAMCWSVCHPIYEVEERLELRPVLLAANAVHLYVDEKIGLVADEPDDDHDYEHIV